MPAHQKAAPCGCVVAGQRAEHRCQRLRLVVSQGHHHRGIPQAHADGWEGWGTAEMGGCGACERHHDRCHHHLASSTALPCLSPRRSAPAVALPARPAAQAPQQSPRPPQTQLGTLAPRMGHGRAYVHRPGLLPERRRRLHVGRPWYNGLAGWETGEHWPAARAALPPCPSLARTSQDEAAQVAGVHAQRGVLLHNLLRAVACAARGRPRRAAPQAALQAGRAAADAVQQRAEHAALHRDAPVLLPLRGSLLIHPSKGHLGAHARCPACTSAMAEEGQEQLQVSECARAAMRRCDRPSSACVGRPHSQELAKDSAPSRPRRMLSRPQAALTAPNGKPHLSPTACPWLQPGAHRPGAAQPAHTPPGGFSAQVMFSMRGPLESDDVGSSGCKQGPATGLAV